MATTDRTGFRYSSSGQMAAWEKPQDDSALLKPPTHTSSTAGSRSNGASPLFPDPGASFTYSPGLERNTEATDHLGRTALHQFANNGDIKSIKGLMPIAASELNAKDCEGDTPLILALRKCDDEWDGHSDCALTLIGANGDLDAVNRQGFSALHIALTGIQPRLTDALVQAGANRERKGVNENTPLHIALYVRNSTPFIPPFLTANNLKATNADGDPPLHVAAKTGKVRQLTRCFKAGFKLHVTGLNYAGNTALHEALLAEKIESARALIKMRHRFLHIPDTEGNFPLHLALMKPALSSLIPYLTAPKAKGAFNAKGESPFLLALKKNATKHLEGLDTLAVRTTPDHRGNTPLHIASAKGLIRWIQPLATELTLSAPNRAGNTPLHLASLNGQPEAARLLIRLGADRHAKNKRNETPQDLVLEGLKQKSAQLEVALLETQARKSTPMHPSSPGECPF